MSTLQRTILAIAAVLAAMVVGMVLAAYAHGASFTAKELNDPHVGTSKQELRAQEWHSRQVVRFFLARQHHWMLWARRSSCLTLRGLRVERVCRTAREQLRAHRWLYEVAQSRLAALAVPTRATRVTYSVGYWEQRQIAAAESIGRSSSKDPWPNCPDPFDGGGSWYDTVACENGGSWLDSPGYYRCGLQFDPAWERVYGRLCP
jgi:hypothetical protein